VPERNVRPLALFLLALLAGCSSAPHRSEPPLVAGTPRADAANAVPVQAQYAIGTPYRYGGNTPQSGFDCSGLVGYVFRDVAGVDLPRTAQDIGSLDAPHVTRKDLESGDVVLFGNARHIDHIGIYVGRGRFVHAPNSGGTVRLDELDGAYWNDHYAGALRLLR